MAQDLPDDLRAPPPGVGAQLRSAREAAGLSQADIAARTKINERYVSAIEAGNFSALASRTYAIGFSRTLARALGLDEQSIVAAVQAELRRIEGEPASHGNASFEPGDPSRIPSRRTAWLAAGAALMVVLGGYFAWSSYYDPAPELPSLVPEPSALPADPASPGQGGATSTQGPVVFTALEDGVWVKFYDAAGTQLMQKELALGESYTVPADAQGPQLWTARPEALQIAIGGQIRPKLSEMQVTMKDVPVSASALMARASTPGTAASPPATPASEAQQRAAPAPARASAPAAQRRAEAQDQDQGAAAQPAETGPLAQPSTISE